MNKKYAMTNKPTVDGMAMANASIVAFSPYKNTMSGRNDTAKKNRRKIGVYTFFSSSSFFFFAFSFSFLHLRSYVASFLLVFRHVYWHWPGNDEFSECDTVGNKLAAVLLGFGLGEITESLGELFAGVAEQSPDELLLLFVEVDYCFHSATSFLHLVSTSGARLSASVTDLSGKSMIRRQRPSLVLR